MKIWICFVFIFSFNFISSQSLDENKDINLFLKNVISEDDNHDRDIEIRIQYINDFNKKVLINYVQTPDDLVKRLNKKELELLGKIYQVYFSEVNKRQSEFYLEQKFKYKSLTPKSRINQILLIDELENYPDTYSVLSTNELLQIKNKNLSIDLNSIVEIYNRNSNLLSQLLKDVVNYKNKFTGSPIYYPDSENSEEIDFNNKINAVLWSYSSSKFYFNKIKSDQKQ